VPGEGWSQGAVALAKAARRPPPGYGWQARRSSMYYVYLLQSEPHPDQRYIGFTTDLKARVANHNAKRSRHTSKFVPWRLIAYFAFRSKDAAVAFERYLKSGSGRAFAERHVWKASAFS
jgi:predicted GIY-YIG superfamily endonuclease